MSILQGVITPVLTPMHADESINIDALPALIDRQIQAGVHGIFCLGTNGEFYNLTLDEKLMVIEATVKAVNGRVPVFAGTGCPGTRDTIELSLRAQALGVDAVSIITPYFGAVSQQEIIAHYTAIAKQVRIPILLYNMPARTGCNIAPETASTLSRIDGIVGIKDSSGNFDNMLRYIELTRGSGFSVLSGNDSLILWNLLAGGTGGVSGCANVYPATMVSIYRAFLSGNIEEGRRIQDSIRPLRNLFRFGNPNTIIKAASNAAGCHAGPCRAPFQYISEEGQREIVRTVAEDLKRGLH